MSESRNAPTRPTSSCVTHLAAGDTAAYNPSMSFAPTAELVSRAKAWVKANPNAKAPWDDPKFKIPGGGPNSPGGLPVFTFGNAMLAKQTWLNYPAQKHIMSAVYEGLGVPMDAALRIESRYFVKTLMTPEAKGMIRSLFLSMQDLSKGASRPGVTRTRRPW